MCLKQVNTSLMSHRKNSSAHQHDKKGREKFVLLLVARALSLLPRSQTTTTTLMRSLIVQIVVTPSSLCWPRQLASRSMTTSSETKPSLSLLSVARQDRFGDELGEEVWEGCNAVFDRLPLASVIDHDIFCVHGGIPRPLPESTSRVQVRALSLSRSHSRSWPGILSSLRQQWSHVHDVW